MTNQEKYKTAEERIKAFDDFCKGQGDRCNHCEVEAVKKGCVK